MPVKVSELGEFGLIGVLARVVSQGTAESRLVIGIGDDAAAWQVDASTLLATTDTLVQGVHFSREANWRELGWKALAVSLSDIAAMGGLPQYALMSLCLPGDTEVDDVIQLCLGMKELAEGFGVAIAGGNVSGAPVVMISLSVIGKAHADGVLTRSAAQPGDLVAVTGYPGVSAAGLRMMSGGLLFPEETVALLRRAHLQPMPRIAEGQALVKVGVRAAIDTSDGLVADLGHLCEASDVGAIIRVQQVPIHPALQAAFPGDHLHLALNGGEDYELLFAASSEAVEKATTSIGAPDRRRRSGLADDWTECPVTVIGEITREGGVSLVDDEGRPFEGIGGGWDHFRKGG